jgi:hypothetical protein
MFNQKKKYFKGMLNDADKVIWDLEFKKFTALNERETGRRQYDQLSDALARITAQLENNKDDEKLLAEKAEVEKNIKDTQSYIDSIDATISGGAPSETMPNGAEGIDSKLSAWVTRREYIKSFLNLNT